MTELFWSPVSASALLRSGGPQYVGRHSGPATSRQRLAGSLWALLSRPELSLIVSAPRQAGCAGHRQRRSAESLHRCQKTPESTALRPAFLQQATEIVLESP